MPQSLPRRHFLVLLAAAVAASACRSPFGSDDPDQHGSTDLLDPGPPALAGDPRLAPATNRFGLGLFKQLTAALPGENVVASPLSVATALTMAYGGAAGETAAQMAKLLGLEGLSIDDADRVASALEQMLLHADPKVTLAIANAIWLQQGQEVEPAFLDINKRFFGARVAALDFAQPEAKDTINAWVSANTRGKIPSIIDKLTPAATMVLTNAVYFKAGWHAPFNTNRTRSGDFHRADGSATPARLMSSEGRTLYFEEDGAQMIELPYADGRFAMTLVLPPRGTPLEALAAQIDLVTWDRWTAALANETVSVLLPRFKMEYSVQLNSALAALGMTDAFNSAVANFEGMRRQGGLYVGEVKHRAFVEVNEEGTEAAAATSVDMVAGAAPNTSPVRQFTFIADRPFLFAIRERQSSALLFLGAVNAV